MEQFSASQAKQKFGELMKAAALAPVAIERHGKVRALVMAPSFFPEAAAPAPSNPPADRRMARLEQAMIEKDRLIRHQRIALDLMTLPKVQRDAMLQSARDTVARWAAEGLSSRDYIDRWTQILAMPMPRMATEMVSDAQGWGTALRQNSPWVGLHA